MNRLNRDNNNFFQLDDNEMNIKELIAINSFYFPDNTETQKVEIFPNQDTFYYLDEYFGEETIDVDNKIIDLKLDSIADVIFKMGNYINTYLVVETAGIPNGVTLHLLDENYNQLYSPFTTDRIYSKTPCNITVGEVDAIVLPAEYISETNWVDLTAGIYNWYLKFDGNNKYDEKIIPITIEIRDFETAMAMPFVIEENDDLTLKIRNYADEIPLALINEGLINEEGILTYENKLIGTDSGNNNLLVPLNEPNSRANYFVNEPTITLEEGNSKTILSEYNSDSYTLFATVLNQREEPIINKKIDFFKNNEYIGSSYTSENGIAYIEGQSTGEGKISFIAKYNNIESNEYNMIDASYYNNGSSINGLIAQSEVSCTSNGEWVSITTSSSGEKYVVLPIGTVSSSDNWEVSFIVNRTEASIKDFSFGLIKEDSYTPIQNLGRTDISTYHSKGYENNPNHWYFQLLQSGFRAIMNISLSDGDKVTIQRKKGFWYIYKNDVQKNVNEQSWSENARLAFTTNNGQKQVLKDILFRPLKTVLNLTGNKTTFVSGDEIVLTATLLDIDDEPIPDEGIVFYNGSTELETVVTDENGVATFTYTPNNTEDLNFTAIMETGDITSNEYNVEGYFFSDRAKDTNHTEEWVNYNNILSVLRDSSGTYLKNETENNGYYIATQNQLESFVMEFKVTVIEGDSYISYDSENGEIRLDTRINPGDNVKLVYKNNKTHIFINDEYTTYLETEALTDISLMLLPSSKLKFSNFVIKKFKHVLKDISLTGDKDILSSRDEETCTLSATVIDEINEGVPDQTVKFYNGETFMGAVITDANGVANMNYAATGVGRLQFVATLDGFENELFDVMDCIEYDLGILSNNNNIWSYSSDNLSFVREEEYTSISLNPDINSGNAYVRNLDSDVVVDFEYYQVTGSVNAGFVGVGSSTDTLTLFSLANMNITGSEQIRKWHKLRLKIGKYQATLISLDDESKRITKSYEVTGTPDRMRFRLLSTNGTSIRVKNIMVYKLDLSDQTVDTVELTSDKSIISSANSDTATLTATVLDNDEWGIEGKTVTFTMTNSQLFHYNGANGTEKDSWNIQTGASMQSDATGTTVSKTSTGNAYVWANLKGTDTTQTGDYVGDCVVEINAISVGENSTIGFYESWGTNTKSQLFKLRTGLNRIVRTGNVFDHYVDNVLVNTITKELVDPLRIGLVIIDGELRFKDFNINGTGVIGTNVTGDDGVAEYEYEATGAGDLSFKASVDMIYSEAYTIIDGLAYFTKDNNPFSNVTVNGDYYTVRSSTAIISLSTPIQLPSAFEISYTGYLTESGGKWNLLMVGEEANCQQYNIGMLDNGAFLRKGRDDCSFSYLLRNNNQYSSNTDISVVYRYQNNTHTLIVNGVTYTSNNTDFTPNYFFGIGLGTNGRMKNILIKEL